MSKFYSTLITQPKVGEEYIDLIVEEVCKMWGVTPEYVSQQSNAVDNSEPFHVIVSLVLEFIEQKIKTSFFRENLAARFGRKRSITYHSQKTVESLEFADLKFREKMKAIRSIISIRISQKELEKHQEVESSKEVINESVC